LAIITMQMMPKISWPQRVASDAVARGEMASVVLVVTVSSIPPVLIERYDETSPTLIYYLLFMIYEHACSPRRLTRFPRSTSPRCPGE
jgi:hypothetical protein